MELVKQRLARRPKFNAKDAFDVLDSQSLSFLTVEGLRHVFSLNKYHPSEPDLIRLVFRFDKNKNGRISYTEFVDELMPKNCLAL